VSTLHREPHGVAMRAAWDAANRVVQHVEAVVPSWGLRYLALWFQCGEGSEAFLTTCTGLKFENRPSTEQGVRAKAAIAAQRSKAAPAPRVELVEEMHNARYNPQTGAWEQEEGEQRRIRQERDRKERIERFTGPLQAAASKSMAQYGRSLAQKRVSKRKAEEKRRRRALLGQVTSPDAQSNASTKAKGRQLEMPEMREQWSLPTREKFMAGFDKLSVDIAKELVIEENVFSFAGAEFVDGVWGRLPRDSDVVAKGVEFAMPLPRFEMRDLDNIPQTRSDFWRAAPEMYARNAMRSRGTRAIHPPVESLLPDPSPQEAKNLGSISIAVVDSRADEANRERKLANLAITRSRSLADEGTVNPVQAEQRMKREMLEVVNDVESRYEPTVDYRPYW